MAEMVTDLRASQEETMNENTVLSSEKALRVPA